MTPTRSDAAHDIHSPKASERLTRQAISPVGRQTPALADPWLNLHAIIPRSRANGPGVRTVIWFQGCSLGCPNCFNPQTHADVPATILEVTDLMDSLKRSAGLIEGITISGGEPLQQSEGLLELLRRVRDTSRLSVILYSGYSLAEIQRMPLGCTILLQTDVLIDGRYVHSQRLGSAMRGSANQRIHLLTDRYTLKELEATAPCEIQINSKGEVIVSGVRPVSIGPLPSDNT